MTDPVFIENAAFKKTDSPENKYIMIWLHGLGADGNDFIPMAYELEKQIDLPLCFIFPHAPKRAVTLNNGYMMSAWYDITGLGLEAREDREGLTQTFNVIDHLIQTQINAGIPSQHIFLGGFSQGGASAVYTGIRYPNPLAGIIVFSGYLPFYKKVKLEKNAANQETPIFWAQGTEDKIVLPQWGKISVRSLKQSEFSVNLKTYPMAHEIYPEQMKDFIQWILEIAGVLSAPIIMK